jgi:hypothetical protein
MKPTEASVEKLCLHFEGKKWRTSFSPNTSKLTLGAIFESDETFEVFELKPGLPDFS